MLAASVFSRQEDACPDLSLSCSRGYLQRLQTDRAFPVDVSECPSEEGRRTTRQGEAVEAPPYLSVGEPNGRR